MKSTSLFAFLCAVAVLMASPINVLAVEEELAPGFGACVDKAQTTADHIDCFGAAYKYWDKILNNNYASALKLCEDQESPEQCKKKLKNAQLKWIQYNEAMLEAISALGSGGTADRLHIDYLSVQETKRQALLLKSEFLEQNAN